MITIRNTPAYTFQSAGNGAVFLLTRKWDGADVFFQGDDAVRVDSETENLYGADFDRWAADYF